MARHGTTERLAFDLALYTGAAHAPTVRLSRRNERDGLLTYTRQKTHEGGGAHNRGAARGPLADPDICAGIPPHQLRKAVRSAAGFGNFFADAAAAAG